MFETNFIFCSIDYGAALYPAAGASDDWARGGAGIKYSYTIELPDQNDGKHGFLLPAKQINSVGESTFKGVRAMLLDIIRISKKKTKNIPSTLTYNSPSFQRMMKFFKKLYNI